MQHQQQHEMQSGAQKVDGAELSPKASGKFSLDGVKIDSYNKNDDGSGLMQMLQGEIAIHELVSHNEPLMYMPRHIAQI